MKGTDPETQQKCDSVFIPNAKKGEWDAEITVSAGVENETLVDTDVDALLAGQLPGPQRFNISEPNHSQFVCRIFIFFSN